MDQATLPNLFVPGAQKSGTSTLHEYLSRHPDIFMSPSKEPHYLTRRDKGIDYYPMMFQRAGTARYRGESSTGYMVSPRAVRMIKEIAPDPRFIFLLRNPVDRAWSHYSWVSGRYGRQSMTFEEAFLDDVGRAPPDPMPDNRGYYHNGLYDKWLAMYLDAFGTQRVFVAIFEEFVTSPLETLNRICSFLAVEPFWKIEQLHVLKTETIRFPRVLRAYSEAGRIGGKIAHHFPGSLQAKLLRAYQAGDSQYVKRLSTGRPLDIDQETRGWVAGFYRESVESLRPLTGIPLGAWDRDFPTITPVVSPESMTEIVEDRHLT